MFIETYIPELFELFLDVMFIENYYLCTILIVLFHIFSVSIKPRPILSINSSPYNVFIDSI